VAEGEGVAFKEIDEGFFGGVAAPQAQVDVPVPGKEGSLPDEAQKGPELEPERDPGFPQAGNRFPEKELEGIPVFHGSELSRAFHDINRQKRMGALSIRTP